jgi:hypothetical protein
VSLELIDLHKRYGDVVALDGSSQDAAGPAYPGGKEAGPAAAGTWIGWGLHHPHAAHAAHGVATATRGGSGRLGLVGHERLGG